MFPRPGTNRGPTERSVDLATGSTDGAPIVVRYRGATRGVAEDPAPARLRPIGGALLASLNRGAKTCSGGTLRPLVAARVTAPLFVLEAGFFAPATRAVCEKVASPGTGAGPGARARGRVRDGAPTSTGLPHSSSDPHMVGPLVSVAKGAISRMGGAPTFCIRARKL